jgi:hypothetical protein
MISFDLRCFLVAASAWAFPAAGAAPADERLLDPGLHHLRAGPAREWMDFPETPEGPRLTVRFQAAPNTGEATLSLRQEDVKQAWRVLLNGSELGRLTADENDLVLLLAIPAGRLVEGENVVRVEQADRTPDDIRVGEIALIGRPREEVLSEAIVQVRVADADRPGEPLPCRITVVDSRGALAPLGASTGDRLAVRTGVIYTAGGTAAFGVRAGSYLIHAGRGFEYGVESSPVIARAGDSILKELRIRREVPTAGYVSCDTHLHTLSHSGHGDATTEERLLTLAGEGIELAVATEHNRQVDYREAAVKAGVLKFVTPVVGNEVTTSVGHFNAFPAPAGAPRRITS